MNTWIKADHYFGDPWIIFTVPWTQALAIELRDTVQRWRDDPVAMEKAVVQLVSLHRPGLADGAVTCVRFDPCYQRWEIAYAHPALPRVAGGVFPEQVPLIPLPGQVDRLDKLTPDAVVEAALKLWKEG